VTIYPMLNLIQKIEANAERKLVLPPGQTPQQEINRYKHFLKLETARLKMLHRSGTGGRMICQARASVLDSLIRHIIRAVPTGRDTRAGQFPMALVATGGYGRGELNPLSDIDIMFLHDGKNMINGKPNSVIGPVIEGVLYSLWDVGMKVGHSVRSVEECVKEANSDMQSKTALIEARLISGNPVLFAAMQQTVEARCVRGFEDAYIAARLEDQRSRRAKYGDSACMQEPNIKNGCGGLRDYQNLLWMAFFKYRLRSLVELEQRGQLSATERRQLEAAYDFLLRVRNDLHYQVNRSTDSLTKSVQPAIAHNLGYTDRSIIRRIEAFMRELYTHMRNIYLITRTLEQRLALMAPPVPHRLSLRRLFQRSGNKNSQAMIDGFELRDSEIYPGSTKVFNEQPRRLMRVFLYAQQRGFKLHPDLAQMVRNQVGTIDKAFLYDTHVRETFLEILNQRGNVAAVLRPMHETGLLGRYLPEFGRLTCLVQHEFFHRYTADEHTLMCLEKLDQVWHAVAPPFNRFTDLFNKVENPYVLYLSLLLHDAGRASNTRKHTEGSLRVAQRVAKRLALESSTAGLLCFLIQHHLDMIQVSQRRDLDDPAVAHKFASLAKTPERLNLLLLHTFADSMGTSVDLWTDFKESLLWTLFDRTRQCLEGAPSTDREFDKQRSALANSVKRMMPRYLGEDELQSHFDNLPPRYFQTHSSQEILADILLVNRFLQQQAKIDQNALEPVTAWQDEPDRGYTAVSICTWDRPGLFSRFCGALTAVNLNILSAKIFSRKDGIIIDTFFVTDAPSGQLPGRESRDAFEQILARTFAGQTDIGSVIARSRIAPAASIYDTQEPLPTEVHFDNTSSETHTIIDVVTADRLGLLYRVSSVMSELDLDISLAKICTEKGAAMDSFYVVGIGDDKITAQEQQKFISDKLKAAIRQLNTPSDTPASN
jgi:[protein-PII] uridylyltransferase